MRRTVQVLLLLVAMAPISALALGLGNIKLNSALNQPLDAEIELVSAAGSELDSLQISLASVDAFASYGLDRPAFLSGMRFSIVRAQGGRSFVRVSTSQPVREPFVTFLVEADWARGRLLREYTVLLDPPVFTSEQAAPVPSAPRPTSEAVTRPAAGAVAREPASASPQPSAPAAAPARAQPADGALSVRYGPIRRNETLWTIASRLRPEQNISINQMMIALYRENPQAFMGNINLLRQGAVLRVPSTRDIYALTTNEAFREVRSQNAAWRGSRPTTADRRPSPAAARETASGTSAAQAGRLRLVPPGDADRAAAERDRGPADVPDAELAGNAALSERIRGLEGELDNARRLIEVKDSELATLQARLDALEARLAAEAAAVTPAAGVPEAAEPVATEAAAEGALEGEAPPVDEPAPEPEVAEPVSPPPAVVSRPPEAPGFFSRIVDFFVSAWVWILGLLGVGLLAAAALFLRNRAQEEDYSESWETGEWKAPEPPPVPEEEPSEPDTEAQPAPKFDRDESFVVEEAEDTISEEALQPEEADELAAALGDAFEDTGTFTPGELEVEKAEQADALTGDGTAEYPFEDTMIGHDALKLDESDPLAEADFHMAYGLYDQAAALVEGAISKEPERHDLKMKLLEIFFVWGNKDRFLQESESLKATLGDDGGADWEKVVIMGQQLCPGEDLFAAGDATGMAAVPDLEFAFGDDKEAAPDTDLDFLGEEGESAGGEDVMELDLTGAMEEAADAGAADRDLDTLKEKIESQLEPSEETLDLGSTHLDLDLEGEGDQSLSDTGVSEIAADAGPSEVTGEHPAPEGVADVDMDIDLDFEFEDVSDDEPTVVMEEAGDEEVAAILEERPDDDDPTRVAAVVDELADETVLAEGTDFDPFTADEDKTVQAPGVGAEDHGATQLLKQPESFGDETGEMTKLLPEMDDEDAGHGGTRQMERPDFAGDSGTRQMEKPDFSGDETVQISRDMDEADPDATMRADFGDLENDRTTQIPVVPEGEQEDLDADLEESTQKLKALELPEEDDRDEVGTKLDLAKAFVDMGDPDGARNILDEVLDEGNDAQKKEARSLLDSLG